MDSISTSYGLNNLLVLLQERLRPLARPPRTLR